MGRKNIPDRVKRARKRAEAGEDERSFAPDVTLSAPAGWIVKLITEGRAVKQYRCPGCDHEINPGTAHVVAWRIDDEQGRRHWHRGCWGSARKRIR
jgi:hypothetical protein